MDKKPNEFIRFIKFGLFSASAGLVETALFYLLGLFPGINYWLCYMPALIVSVIWNFTLNRRFTFNSSSNVPRAMFKTFAFYAVFIPVSTVLGEKLAAAYKAYPAADDIIFFTTLIINFVLEFLYQRLYVFRGQTDNR
ncbi:MAG: GtrA family protein [Eubacteriales bacterium]